MRFIRWATLLLLTLAINAVVSSAELIIGQTASLSGPSQKLGNQVKDGIESYFKKINRLGGIRGRTLKLVTLDDAGNGKQAQENVHKLTEAYKALAIISPTTRLAASAIQSITLAKHVPVVGPTTGSVHDQHVPYWFNTRASYKQEFEKIISNRYVTYNARKFALLYVADDKNKIYEKLVTELLKKYGLSLSLSEPVNRDGTTDKNLANKVLNARPDVVLCAVPAVGLAPIIRQIRLIETTPTYFASFSFDADNLISALDKDADGIIFSSVVPLPTARSFPIVREYQVEARTSGGDVEFNEYSLEGFIAAKILVEAISRIDREITAEKINTALETIKNFDVGGVNISFYPLSTSGSEFVDLTIYSHRSKKKLN